MIGVEQRSDGTIGIVSEWMENKSLSHYLSRHTKDTVLNRLQLVSFRIVRFRFPLNMTWARSWRTFARACSTCTRNKSFTVISKAYVRCISGDSIQFLSPCLYMQENILVDKNGRANLADFGMTTLMHRRHSVNPSTQSNCAGTEGYLAPEVIDPERYGLTYRHVSLPGDIYALGVVMWQVWHRCPSLRFHFC